MEDPMQTANQLKICNELVGLYQAQLPLVEPTDLNTARGWTIADLQLYNQRAERIANLQRQLVESHTERCPSQGEPDDTSRELGRPLIEKAKQLQPDLILLRLSMARRRPPDRRALGAPRTPAPRLLAIPSPGRSPRSLREYESNGFATEARRAQRGFWVGEGTRVCVATGSCGHISSPGILPTTICWAQRPRKFGCHTDSYTPRAMRMVIKIKGLRE